MISQDKQSIINLFQGSLELWYTLSTDYEKLESKAWYETAHVYADIMSSDYNIALPKVCAIIAVLSPGCDWDTNISDTNNLLKAYHDNLDVYGVVVSTYHNQFVKACKILALPNDVGVIELENHIGKSSARKTISFYHNILEPDNPSYVTIDRWIIRALGLNTPSTTALQYECGSIAIHNIAHKYGFIPCQLQAIIWVVIRSRGGNFQYGLE